MIEILLRIAYLYVFLGLGFVLAYLLDAGRLISKKYGCGLIEGIYRFEKAGSIISNIKAVLYGVLIWPRLYAAMKNGTWDTVLGKMVEESDYEIYDPSEER